MTELQKRMIEGIQIAGLNEGIQKSIARSVKQLAEFFSKPPDRITETEIGDYFLHVKNEKKRVML